MDKWDKYETAGLFSMFISGAIMVFFSYDDIVFIVFGIWLVVGFLMSIYAKISKK